MVKRLKQVLWDELVETLLQSEELGLNATHEPPVHVESEQQQQQIIIITIIIQQLLRKSMCS